MDSDEEAASKRQRQSLGVKNARRAEGMSRRPESSDSIFQGVDLCVTVAEERESEKKNAGQKEHRKRSRLQGCLGGGA